MSSSINNPLTLPKKTSSLLPTQPNTTGDLPVLGLDVVGKGLGLLEAVVVVIVVVVVGVLGTDVVHLVDVAALGAALDGALASHLLSSVNSLFVGCKKGMAKNSR